MVLTAFAPAPASFSFSGHLGVYAEHLDAGRPFVDFHGDDVALK